MISKRLKEIANLIPNNSKVIDVGCDHGLLDIYLTQNKNCKCIASDISEKVLKNTKENISKYNLTNKIEIICSDGLNNINNDAYDTLVISGMGTATIINILNNKKIKQFENLIIQSNNDLEVLRKYVIKLGYYISDEKIILDKNKYYVIIKFKKGIKKYKSFDYLFGPIARIDENNKDYFKKMLDKNKCIYNKLSKKHIMLKLKIKKNIYNIKKFTCVKM